jgi:hypothetical protein
VEINWLTSILGGTPFHDILNKYHNEEFVCRTSAGAASIQYDLSRK